jgi:hypothetical protein
VNVKPFRRGAREKRWHESQRYRKRKKEKALRLVEASGPFE